VLEAEIAGFGASGRNGGWCSAVLPMSLDRVASLHGREAALALQHEMFATVDEVGAAAAREGIDCSFAKGGTLTLATQPPQLARLKAQVAGARRFGLGERDVQWLARSEARAMVGADGVLGGVYTPHCAAIQPAKLARGLARAVERLSVAIYERTRAVEISPGRVTSEAGTVRAEVVVRATEAFTAQLRGHHRDVAPLYSLMIATEPLPQSFWDEVGWTNRCTLDDARHLIVYAQRTAGGRIAFGGRGAPYHFGSRVAGAYDRDPAVFADLRRTLGALFPSLHGVGVTHEWGGPLAAPRDWYCSVRFDRATGLASAGGYVGDGVATTNLAGRTLAHLITGTESHLTRLPWVNHQSRRWEPEPLRWLGINAALRLPAGADAHEARTGRPSRSRTWLLHRLLGH
jgi:glycine/D-amino acid oxidase-like deaminating enzyme